MAETPVYPVQLWCYDLSQGLARDWGMMLVGRELEAIWHTSIVVHGVEWFFGAGISHCEPGTTPFGQPLKKVDLGVTQVSKDLLTDLVADLGSSTFRKEDYNLLHHNCNHFSDTLATVLVGSGISKDILTQHEVILASPIGQTFAPMLQQMEMQLGNVSAGQQNAGDAPPF